MTPEQYERFRDFALRAARVVYARSRRPSRRWIEEMVQDFIDGIEKEDIPCIRDWDHSDNYAEGTPHYQKTYRCLCWHCEGTLSGKRKSKATCPYRCEDGKIYDYAHPYCLGDMMSEWETGRIYYDVRDLMTVKELKAYEKAWDRDDDDRVDEIRDAVTDYWANPVRACVRAALDVACAPSAGVVGWSAGDLRRMYPEGVPDWVKGKDQWFEEQYAECALGLILKKRKKKARPKKFDELADNEPLWL